jgi:hypothetical protein
MEREKVNYMEGMVLYKEEDKMKMCIEKIVKEFRIDGFDDCDIELYLIELISKVVYDKI